MRLYRVNVIQTIQRRIACEIYARDENEARELAMLDAIDDPDPSYRDEVVKTDVPDEEILPADYAPDESEEDRVTLERLHHRRLRLARLPKHDSAPADSDDPVLLPFLCGDQTETD